MRASLRSPISDCADKRLIDRFEHFVTSPTFPCVGAKSALSRSQLEYRIENDLRYGPNAFTVSSLQEFSQAYSSETPLFQSFVVLFRQPGALTERAFEAYLWRYLQRMHDTDADLYDWDSEVSRDPDTADFSFSIGGRAYYVVGLHPDAGRTARRFFRPALVFNLHDQFDRLRHKGKYENIRDTIIRREAQLEGNPNPMLKPFGTLSEARQYSGRVVDDQWKCPFHAH
ncbi:MAG: YqcI/YcgG family protein [Sulfuriferula multivorans]|uniref:YqcI/YcgG family protein n=1 Tax=Sulfuriferula multivorans TaxID=1559896 RepID=A0A7C9NZ34_9PROT|nr:YqcI/YcgG family protein [Sulfuriferula multivorans]